MNYDQAQSPRLGQRVPIESTYVQIVDVAPGNETADLIEAAWPGMLVFRQDLSILQIYNGDAGAWQDVAGGVAGQLTYVGPTLPSGTGFSIGDLYYDDDDQMKAYIWDGDSWELVSGGAVYNYVVEYAVNSSETVAPTTGWSSATPTRAPGTFVWVRTVITYNDGTTTTANPALMTGNTGAAGSAGPQGVPGPTGENGQQLYTWVKYADTPTTGMADDPTGKEYMGLAYNKTTATESSTYADYQWSLTKGADGTDGADGVPGPPGVDGQPTYTWIRYADNISGGGISNSSVGKTHIGLAYNKTTATESNTPGDYEWSLIQGPPGTNAATITLTSTTQALVSPSSGTGATSPTTATVTGTSVNTTITVWEYSVNSAAFSATVPPGVGRTGNVVTITGSTMTAATIAVRMADAAGVADTLTVAKVLNGATGSTGGTGPAGADAYTVLLTNEAHAFPGTTTTAVAGSTTSQVIAYKAAGLMPATIGTITGQVTGLTTAITNNTTTTAGFTVTVTTALVALNGELSIPVTVDGVGFTKKFSWSVSRAGSTGGTGPTGVSVSSIVPYFAKVTTGAAAPAQPAIATPAAPWVTPEPVYTADTELYRTEKVTYSDATFSYTTVSKVSSYSGVNELDNTKTQTYYANGFTLITPGDPSSGFVLDVNGTPILTPIAGNTVGDIWYQIDDDYRMRWYDGTQWLDATNPYGDITDAIDLNAQAITIIQPQVMEAGFLAASANNTADTADGRISMSDYTPGLDDVTYTVTRQQLDPDTGEPFDVQVEVPRNNGSLWMTRTRPRQNWCKNPSVETNTTGWGLYSCSFIREAAAFVPAGIYTLQVTNSATSEGHYVQWGAGDPVPCTPGQTWTASSYAELVSGTPGGTGVDVSIIWLDSVGATISTSAGTPQPLELNAFNPITIGTVSEPRVHVTAEAPALAETFYVRITASAGNESVVWHTGAVLIEQGDDLGRYFDGDSYDGHWDGVAHASTSYLEGGQVLELWELRDSSWVRKYLNQGTLAPLPGTKIIAPLSGAVISPASVSTEAMRTELVQASEALAIGDLVHVWSSAGLFRVRKANAALKYEAHGFVWAACASGAMARVYHVGYNPFMAGLTPGPKYLSTTAGKASSQPPFAVGQILQQVGYATSATTLNFQPSASIRIT